MKGPNTATSATIAGVAGPMVVPLLLSLVLVAACAGKPDDPAAPTVEVASALRLVDDDASITCGPFVDGIADGGRDFESGPCKGEPCTDSCGCICLKCDGDFGGACFGLCAQGEGCDALSQPPGGWRVELEGQIATSIQRGD